MGSMRTSLQLYRDCLRLIKHMAGSSSPKAVHLRSILSSQFREHKHEMDPARIQALKAGCVWAGCLAMLRVCRKEPGCSRRVCALVQPSQSRCVTLCCPAHSAERGLSNYLVYYSSKTDAKVAAHAKDVGTYADVEGEGLVRVDVAPQVVRASGAGGQGAAPPLRRKPAARSSGAGG